MKKTFCLVILLCLVGFVNADLYVTNGDFEAGGGENIPDVTGWYDNSTANFWENAWQTNASYITPNATNVVVFCAWNTAEGDPLAGSYLYQSVGTLAGESEVTVYFDWGCPDDVGAGRHDGLTVSVFASNGSFVAEEAVDIYNAAGVTLLDSASFDYFALGTDGEIFPAEATLDLSGASMGDEIFLRFNNYLPEAGADPWPVLDNVLIPPTIEPVQPADDPASENPVPLTQILEWNLLIDGVEYIDLYLADLDEPNLSTDPGYKVLDFEPVSTTTFAPANLDYSTTYYWKVVKYVSDGNGGYISSSGPVWSFVTVDEAPAVSAVSPSIAVSEAGTSVDISVTGINVVDYQWYKAGEASPLVDGADYAGVATDTLTVKDLQLADEGYFYCVVLNNSGTASNEETGPGRVMVRRLVNHYPMEVINAGDVTPDIVDGIDMSLVSDDVATVGLPTLIADVVDPLLGNSSLEFINLPENDPNGQYGQIPAGALNLGDMTISTWVKWSGTANYQRIFDFGNDTTEYIFLTPNIGGTIRYAMRTATLEEQQLNSNEAIPEGEWVYITITLSGDTARMYVDGELVDTNTDATIDPIDIAPVNNYFGQSQWPDPYFDGQIDEFKIYNYALTTEEVAQDYLDVKGGWVCNNEVEALAFDFNDDCLTDIVDYAIFAATWLDSNRIYED